MIRRIVQNQRVQQRSQPTATRTKLTDNDSDFGLSGALEAEKRLLSSEGRFNARRVGLGRGAVNPYTLLLSMSWKQFFVVSLALYLMLNTVFGLLFFALGPNALSEMPVGIGHRLMATFFFSVQTFGTIGFGHVFPVSLVANALVTLEAFVGLMGVALVTGVLFARFSKPTHRVLFSNRAVITPHKGGHALMFRLVNGAQGDLMDLQIEVLSSFKKPKDSTKTDSDPKNSDPKNSDPKNSDPKGGETVREFRALKLERERVTFFPLAWTVVHPIDQDSPFYALTAENLLSYQAEVIVVLRAIDEISQQSIQTRTSYHTNEIYWGHKFASMYVRESGLLAVDARLVSETHSVDLPPMA